jgi:hypothetical protein
MLRGDDKMRRYKPRRDQPLALDVAIGVMAFAIFMILSGQFVDILHLIG